MLSLVDEYFQNLLMKWCSLVPPPPIEIGTKVSPVVEERGHGSSKTLMPLKVWIPAVH